MIRMYLSRVVQRALRDLLALAVSALWMQVASICLARAARVVASVDRTIGRMTWADWAASVTLPPEIEDSPRRLVALALPAVLAALIVAQPVERPAEVRVSSSPFCAADGQPTIDAAFLSLQAVMDQPLADPADCAHAVLEGAMLVQHLVDGGGLALDESTGDATYTDGAEFWTLAADGQLRVARTPPAGVLLALLVIDPLRADADVAPLTPQPVATARPVVAEQPAPILAPPMPTVAPMPHAPIFFSDPRVLAVTLADLPGGVQAWAKIGDDTTRLLQFQYSIVYGRMPGNGQVFPLDPYFAINVLIADTVEHAEAAWTGTYGKPGTGQRPGARLPAIADEQAYGLGRNLIDVRARQANVILQAIEWTSGTQSISLDDSVTLVRIMASRARDLAR
jgi:hypothetical protein